MVCECDREVSTMTRPCPARGWRAMKIKNIYMYIKRCGTNSSIMNLQISYEDMCSYFCLGKVLITKPAKSFAHTIVES